MERETVFHTLEPWVAPSSRILILGTMPSPKSRETHCYYGHPQNRFWSTLSAVFEEPVPISADQRKAFILRHRLALWDVLASCNIRGAEDAAISAPIANDIVSLCTTYPISSIVTTGKKANELYNKLVRPLLCREAIALPSTSPANRRWYNDAQLLEAYSVLRTL